MNWRKMLWIGLAVLFVLAQVALIVAKLSGRLDWSWWWTLVPLWSPLAGVAVLVVLGVLFFANSSANGGNPFR
jgi:hypothetical protein